MIRRFRVISPAVMISIIAAATLALSPPSCCRSDPITGKVRLIYLGDALGSSPVPYLKDDPLISVTPVLACKMWYPYRTIRKSLRVYLPRTLASLNQSCDILILSDANVMSFESKHLFWFSSQVEVGSMGLAMIGGFESFGGHGFQSWESTTVSKVLPVNCEPFYDASGQIVITNGQCPLVSNLPWDTLGDSNFIEGNVVTSKSAADTVALFSDANPLLVWWDYGSGRSVAMAGDWTPGGGARFMEWDYYGDFASNLVLFTSKEEVPQDLELLHRVREGLVVYREVKGYLYSVLEFAEMFGANMRSIEARISESEDLRRSAARSYMARDFEIAHQYVQDSLDILERSVEDALEAKDRAMAWVFVSEWLAVISTCILSGLVLYELMVSRRLYRSTGSSIFTKD